MPYRRSPRSSARGLGEAHYNTCAHNVTILLGQLNRSLRYDDIIIDLYLSQGDLKGQAFRAKGRVRAGD